MRIAIDYTAAARQRAGIGRYTRALVAALAEVDRDNEYVLHVPRDARYLEATQSLPKNFQVKRAPLNERTLVRGWQRLRVPLPIELFVGKADVFYSPDFVLPPTRARKKILTVHDLSFKRFPDAAVPNLQWYLNQAVPRSVAQADLVLADSDSTRADIIHFFKTPPERVQTLYSGVDRMFARVTDAAELERVRNKYHLHKPFLLNVGTIEPRKNLVRLIEAFSRLRANTGLKNANELLIAGGRGWLYDEIYAAPQKFGVADAVRFLGFTADEDLPALLTLAEVFVYPSLYEGFGLPVLEALACGTAVVTANNSSLPEVAGDAAVLVDAHDTDALTDAMRRVLEDRALREMLQQKGPEQAKKFSWARSARELRAAFER